MREQDEALVERARLGDTEAFGRLYDAYLERIYRYVAARIARRDDAEDLTQQVFLRALESMGAYHWTGVPFSSWLFRIAHNLVIDHYRKGSKLRMVPIEDDAWVSDEDPAAAVELQLTNEEVALASRQLTQAQQEVLALRFAGGLSVADTSKIMGKSEGAVKTLQHAALARLRHVLVSRGQGGNG